MAASPLQRSSLEDDIGDCSFREMLNSSCLHSFCCEQRSMGDVGPCPLGVYHSTPLHEVFGPYLPLECSVAGAVSHCHGTRSRLTGKNVPLRREKTPGSLPSKNGSNHCREARYKYR